MVKTEIIYGFDYGFEVETGRGLSFGNIKLGDKIDLKVRDQYGSSDGCTERNHRRITGEVTFIENLVEGNIETVGEWMISVSDIPLDIPKIRRRIEDKLRKSRGADIINVALLLDINLF